MPWAHCDLDLHDDVQECPVCGVGKAQWTVELGVTRTISIQRRALFRVALVDAAEEPVPGRAFELRVTDGSWREGELDEDGFAKVPSPAEGRGLLRLVGVGVGEVQRLSPPREGEAPLLRVGAEGAAVLDLQELLVERGYPVDVDGRFGPETDGAVRWFQGDRGLGADGVVGPATWGALRDPAAPPPPAPGGLLRQGDEGARVRRLQEALVTRGATLEVDGRFGQATEAALRGFQSGQGLQADGVAGPRTWAALLAGGAAPATLACATDRKHVFQLTRAPAPAVFQLELHDARLPDEAVLVAEGLAAPRRMRAADHHEPTGRRYVFPFPDPRPGPVCRATLELPGATHVLFEGVDLAAIAAGASRAPVFARWPADPGDAPAEEPAPSEDDLDAEWGGDQGPPEDAPRLDLAPPVHDYDPGSHAWGEN